MQYRRLYKLGLVFFAGASIALSCAKPPKIETEEALSITKYGASFYCYVASDYKVEFGILVSREPNPVYRDYYSSLMRELNHISKRPCGIYQFDYNELTPGSKYYFRAYCIQHPFWSKKEKVYYGEVDSLTTLDYEYLAEPVDMGLPSGTKWSNVDLGAFAPNEKGALFFWADSENKHLERNSLCFHWRDEATNTKWTHKKPDGWPIHMALPLTKYCTDSKYGYNGFVDNKYTLEPEDDPAHVYLGDSWRTPTDVEWEELLKDYNCEWTFGKGGCIVRSRHNGNELFFPRSYVRYMSSRISASIPNWFYSYDIFFEPDEETPADDHLTSREHYPALIRPVCD